MANFLSSQICKSAKEYVSWKVRMFIEKGIDISSSLAASLIGIVFFTFSFLLFFFFSTLALAYYLKEYFGKEYWSFLIISILYLACGILFWCFRNFFVKKPISNILYKAFRNKLNN